MADTVGLMGTFEASGKSRAMSRSGVLMSADKDDQEACDHFGLEWQVQKDDPRLFREARAPQWPETCRMPSSFSPSARTSRRLRAADPKLVAMAEEACANKKNPDDYEDCYVDVMATGEPAMADLYS